MSNGLRPFVVAPGSRPQITGPVGGPATILARGEETGGRFAAIDNVIPPRQGPPLHVHHQEDEMWFVLEGNLRFRAGDELLRAPTGSFVFVPRDTRHCFQNIGSESARVLVMFTPAGMERFFDRLSQLGVGSVDKETYQSLAHDSAMDIVGPPLAESDPL